MIKFLFYCKFHKYNTKLVKMVKMNYWLVLKWYSEKNISSFSGSKQIFIFSTIGVWQTVTEG